LLEQKPGKEDDMWKTKICEMLDIEYPILEGGMAIPGNGELAAAVSNAGALGVIGYNPGWAPPEKQVKNLQDHIKRAKDFTNKPLGVNIPIFMEQATGNVKESIDLVVEEKVPVITTSGGDPKLFTEHIKSKGTRVLHVVQNVRQALRAESAGVDAVIASGVDAGGLLGPDEIPTLVLVPLVMDAVKVPVVAAGGIGDSRGFVAAIALGAEGIQMGTIFMATQECHAHRNLKEAMLKATDRDAVVTRRNLPPRVRSLKSNFVKQIEEMERRGASTEEIAAFIGPGRTREGIMLGEIEDGDPVCGLVAAMVRDIPPAGEIVKRIIDGATAIVERCNKIQQS